MRNGAHRPTITTKRTAVHLVSAVLLAVLAERSLTLNAQEFAPTATASTYRGWKSLGLSNGLVEVHVLPAVGGRIIQFKLAGKEFLWVNPQLAGKLPPSNGLAADGGWFNVGGDKLWPAPQGWDNDRQWPGPPDAVLDGQPYALEQLSARPRETAVRLTSGKDLRSGIQFSRVVRLFAGTARVSFEATMKNIDTKPRRWGIWAHTQLDGAKADGSGHNRLLQAWCPLNPHSKFPQGHDVIFGDKHNPSFQPNAARGLMRVQYLYQVGKIGLDSDAGWVATVDGVSGAVFVQRFVFEPKKEYPDGSSVEFWLNGVGRIRAYNKDLVMPANSTENPYVFESEVLSPLAELQPGESYSWRYDWYASNVGGDFPVVGCSEVGVVAEPLTAGWSTGQVRIKGRFGVFAPGNVRAEFVDARGIRLQSLDLPNTASPLKPLVLDTAVAAPVNAVAVKLLLIGADGKAVGELAKADVAGVEAAARCPLATMQGAEKPATSSPAATPAPAAAAATQRAAARPWSPERAWAWYRQHPWLVGFNWGLVNGRTQCQFAWYHKRGTPEPTTWFHDLFHTDGRPYDASEHTAIRQATADKRIDWAASDYGTMRTPRPTATGNTHAQPRMLYGDATRHGRPFAKDPSVIRLGERYLMYYSMAPSTNPAAPKGWAVGIAESHDLVQWQKVGEILPEQECEKNGLVNGKPLLLGGKVHLFYNTYGNGKGDALCHAVSDDGLTFRRDPSNPILRAAGEWNSGRAIDCDAFEHDGKLWLIYATRDPAMKTQMLVAATAPLTSDFGRAAWTRVGDGPILKPELPWETNCIEAPSVIRRGETLYLFYGGGYNNDPQQIGCAVSRDGLQWTRLFRQPLWPHGQPGDWNESETGHPGVFEDTDGKTYLFVQGNREKGRTWFLSCAEIGWRDRRPVVRWDSPEFPTKRPGPAAHHEDGIDYSAGWTCWRGAGPQGGGLHYANQPGCRADIPFRGTGLTLVHKTGPDCGIAQVLVDGQPATIAALDTYLAEVDWNHRTVVAQGLPPGEHKLSILVTDRRNERSSNGYVQIVGYQHPAESRRP